jgi:hypothetical protein
VVIVSIESLVNIFFVAMPAAMNPDVEKNDQTEKNPYLGIIQRRQRSIKKK